MGVTDVERAWSGCRLQRALLQEWSDAGARGTSPPPLSALQCSSPTPRRVSAHQSLIIHHITSNSDFNNLQSGAPRPPPPHDRHAPSTYATFALFPTPFVFI